MEKTNKKFRKNYGKELTDFQLAVLKKKAEWGGAKWEAKWEADEADKKYKILCENNASFGELLDAYETKKKAERRLSYQMKKGGKR